MGTLLVILKVSLMVDEKVLQIRELLLTRILSQLADQNVLQMVMVIPLAIQTMFHDILTLV